jgi:RND family efflux transporter MFP subunit
MKRKNLLLCCALSLALPLFAFAQNEDEESHMHGPDGRHIAVASTFGPAAGQKSILSHHDLRVADANDKALLGCEVHSVIHRKGDPSAVIHREANAYEAENEVYGSHMMYKEPGEYVIVEKITFPDKTTETVAFPVWVPDPMGGATREKPASPAGPSPWLWGIGGLLAAGGAFALGRRSGRKDAATLSLILAATLVLPPALAQETEEESHMHGPDGRHVAVASTFGKSAVPLKAYPTPDQKESADKTVGKYRLKLSIENEEMAPPDPAVVPLAAKAAQGLGVALAPVRQAAGSGELATVGTVQPNPNRLVTISARVGGRVLRVGLTPGDQVRAGHTVAVVESTEIAQLQGTLRQARAEAAQALAAEQKTIAQSAEAQAALTRSRTQEEAAQAQVERARVTLERQKKLAEAGAFALPTVEAARTALTAAEGEVALARAALTAAEKLEKRLTPGLESGVVARRDVEAAQAEAAQARARFETATRQMETARTTLSREERIRTQGLLNAREVQEAESERKAALAGLRTAQAEAAAESKRLLSARSARAEALALRSKAEAAIYDARRRLALLSASETGSTQITITTPIGGEVENRPVNSGEQVASGAPLATILNTDDIWVQSEVFEKDLARVRVGQTVAIAADAVPGQTFTGRIAYIGGEVNEKTRAVKVRTVIANPGERLKPNMFVRVLLGSGGGSALLVPRAALQEDGTDSVVFVKESEDSYRRIVVEVGTTIGDQVVVRKGLKAGQSVVTTGSYQLLALAKKGG